MNMIVFISGCILFSGSFFLGIYTERKCKEKFLYPVAGGLCLILIKMVFIAQPGLEFTCLNYDWYSYIRFWWVFPVFLFVLGLTIFQIKYSWIRIMAEAASGFLVVFLCIALYSSNTFDYDTLKGEVNDDGICMQTYSFSCGAAAAAALLHKYDIQTSEKEMGVLCGTGKYLGTDEFKICRGLREKVDSKVKIILTKMDWNEIETGKLPFMAVIKIGFMSDHWVVISSVKKDSIEIFDPFIGIHTMNKNEFLNVWRKTVVGLEKR